MSYISSVVGQALTPSRGLNVVSLALTRSSRDKEIEDGAARADAVLHVIKNLRHFMSAFLLGVFDSRAVQELSLENLLPYLASLDLCAQQC